MALIVLFVIFLLQRVQAVTTVQSLESSSSSFTNLSPSSVTLPSPTSPNRRTNLKPAWKLTQQEICMKFNYKDCFRLSLPICNNKEGRHCYTVTKDERIYEKVCKYGWTGQYCNIPVCGSCKKGEFCSESKACKCFGEIESGKCLSVSCSEHKTCFPGSCSDGICVCPPGFKGEDCSEIEQAADVKACVIDYREDGKNGAIRRVACGSQGPTWLSKRGTTRFTISFWASLPLNLKSFLPTLNDNQSKFGIVDMFVEFHEDNSTTRLKCGSVNLTNPKTDEECRLERMTEMFGHGELIIIKTFVTLGGYLKGQYVRGSIGDKSKIFESQYSIQTSEFKLDLAPPVHCFPLCNLFPVYLEDDITNKPLIEPKFYMWKDEDSGLDRYNIKVFHLTLNKDRKFFQRNGTRPLIHQDLRRHEHGVNFNCTHPGLYSIELTVLDKVGNYAKVRKIFSYYNESFMVVRSQFPVLVTRTLKDSSLDIFWLFDPEQLNNLTHLTVSWYARFHSNAMLDDNWLKPVEKWKEGMDDKKFRHYGSGRKTADSSVRLYDGIQFFQLDYHIQKNYSSSKGSFDSHFIFAAFTSYDVAVNDLDVGDVVWLNLSCYDLAGGVIRERYQVVVDTTPPEINGLVNDASIGRSGLRIRVEAFDNESGIKGGNYSYADVSEQKTIEHGEFGVVICQEGSEECICTISGYCYNPVMTFDIQGCPCSCRSVERYSVVVYVINRAGLVSKNMEIYV